MYSVMKNKNGCYIKMSSHATSSFHVLHLSKNAKVAIPFLIIFFLVTVTQIVSFYLVVVVLLLFRNIKCNFFLTLELSDLIIYHVFNFPYISKRKVNFTQIRYK